MELRLRTTSKFKRVKEKQQSEPARSSQKKRREAGKGVILEAKGGKGLGWVWGEGSE